MFQLSSKLYEPGFPGSHMSGNAVLDAFYSRNIEDVQNELSALKASGMQLKDIKDEFGNTCLHVASYRGCVNTLDILFMQSHPSMKIDVNTPNVHGLTPLHWACFTESVEVITKLLQKGANPEALDFNGRSPLHIAAESNALQVLDLFLNKYKFPADVCAYSGITPLVTACQESHKSAALVLAKSGADICKKSTLHDGMQYVTPYLIAQRQGWGEELRCAGTVPQTPEPPYLVEQTDDMATFRWHATAGRSAPVQHYKLQIRKIDRLKPDEPWKTVAKEAKERVHTFYVCRANCSFYSRDASPDTDLEPSEVYAVRVLAFSIVGWSKPSRSSKLLLTAPATPCTPAPPTIVRKGNCSVRLRWILPENNGVRIDVSDIQWALCHSPYIQWSSIVDKQLRLPDIDSDEEPSSSESDTDDEHNPLKHVHVCEYTVRDLAPNHYYKFRVRVHNTVGWSYLSEPCDKVFIESMDITTDAGIVEKYVGTNSAKSFNGTFLNAQGRILSFNRFQMEQKSKEEANKIDRVNIYINRNETRASTCIQTWWRCQWLRGKYNTFKKLWNENKYFLIQYGTEEQFLEKWRRKLCAFKVTYDAIQAKEQAARDAKRKRKMERRLRRERRQLTGIKRNLKQNKKIQGNGCD